MIKKDILAVAIVSVYLIVYGILIQYSSTETIAIAMWIVSPFLIVWMVYMVIRHGKYEGSKLGRREFGYGDVEN
jgi:hypothetical protein